jgi:hypothetical protein
MIGAIQGAKPAPAASSGSPAPAAAAATSVLPSPAPLGVDSLSTMFLLEAEDQQFGLQQASDNVRNDQGAMQHAFDQEQQAIKKAEDAAAHESFWHKLGDVCGEVAKVAGVVAAIAVAVGTGGAAAPFAIAAAALSVAGFAEGETHVLEKLGINTGLANAIDDGLCIGGALLSVGAAIAPGAEAASKAALDVGKVAAGVSAVGQAGHGVATVKSALARKDADEADADAAGSEAQQNELRRMVQRALQEAQNADEQDGKTMQIIAGVKAIQSQTAYVAATGMKG